MGLTPGANRIEWVYSSGETTETYYINVNRASAFDTSTLSSLTLSNSTLDERGGALYIYGGSLIPGSDATSGLTATFTTGTATWVNGTNSGSLTSGVISQVPVKRGENTIIITHTAPDTTQTAYTIYVRRAGQWTGFDIRTPGVTMTPAFTSSVHYYTMTDVPYSVSSLTHIVTHSYEEPGHLSCNRCDWWQYSSRGEQTMGLTPGANCIEWVYSSGETTETYYFAINRNSPGSPPTSNCVEPPPTTTTTTTTLPPETTTTTTEPEATTTVPRTTTTVARNTTTVPRTTTTVVDVVPSSGSGASDSGANSTNSPTETSAPLVVSDTPNTTAAPATTSAPTTTTEPEQVDETTTTNPVVVDVNAPVVPEVEIGSAVATIDGKEVEVKIKTNGNKITFSVGGVSGELDASSLDGSQIQLDANSNLVLAPGDEVYVNLAGFGSDTPVEVWMFSIPVKVKDLMADAKGTTNGSFSTPQGIDAGAHRIVVKGLSPENNEVIIALGVEVTAIGNASLTSKLVLPITAAVVVLFIVALTIRLRRRSKLAI
jgi:hypothetical protein